MHRQERCKRSVGRQTALPRTTPAGASAMTSVARLESRSRRKSRESDAADDDALRLLCAAARIDHVAPVDESCRRARCRRSRIRPSASSTRIDVKLAERAARLRAPRIGAAVGVDQFAAMDARTSRRACTSSSPCIVVRDEVGAVRGGDGERIDGNVRERFWASRRRRVAESRPGCTLDARRRRVRRCDRALRSDLDSGTFAVSRRAVRRRCRAPLARSEPAPERGRPRAQLRAADREQLVALSARLKDDMHARASASHRKRRPLRM